jgi:hypothetical protein
VPAASGYFKEGVLLEVNRWGQTHNCSSDVPDIILRDPPGSNSFTSIGKGQTFSFSKEASINAEMV